jgi:hypothetical protein
MFKNEKEGLTLHQIMLILAAFGLILLVTAVLLVSARKESRDNKRLADMAMIRSALELHFHDCNHYPAQLIPGKPIQAPEQCGGRTYLAFVPADPKNKAYYYVPCTGSGRPYNCQPNQANASSYELGLFMETKTANMPKGRIVATPDRLY